MLDQGSDPEIAETFAERLLVVALIGCERPQIARISSGDLLGKVCAGH